MFHFPALDAIFDESSIRSLRGRDFETQTANGSNLFSLITRLQAITFTLLSTFSPVGMIRMKMWETPLSWHEKCSLPVAVHVSKTRLLKLPIRSLPQRRRQQERHKIAYLTMKNNLFTRFARAFFIFLHFADVLVLSTTSNDLFCHWVDDVSI